MKTVINPYFPKMQLEKAKFLLDSLYPIVHQINDYRLTGSWLRLRTVQFNLQGKNDSAIYYANLALQLAQAHDTDKKDLLAAKFQLADVLIDLKKYDSALVNAREAYYLASKIDTPGLPLICIKMVEIYNAIKDYSESRKYIFEGMKRSKIPRHKIVFANQIANYYENTGKTDSAIYFLKSIENDTTIASPYFDAVISENLGILLTKKEKLEEGLKYQMKAANLNKTLGSIDAGSYYWLASTYYKLRNFKRAQRSLDTAMSTSELGNDLNIVSKIWKLRANIFTTERKYERALSAWDSSLTHYKEETDSSIIAQAKEIEARYSVKAKDDEISALAFANESNRKISYQKNIIIAGMGIVILLLVAVGILLWRRKQIRQQLNIISLQQKSLRSQMELHFIFSLLGVLQSFIRNGDTEKSIHYLQKFSKLTRLSLENARENFVSLKSELLALEYYLDLQAMQLENRFEYHMKVYEGYDEDDIFIPPMLLQPFAENAVLHGFNEIDYKGVLDIEINRKENIIECIIEDNGAGLKRAAPEKKKRPLATAITQDRLAVLSRLTGRQASLTIMDKLHEQAQSGIKVKLAIPFQQMHAQ